MVKRRTGDIFEAHIESVTGPVHTGQGDIIIERWDARGVTAWDSVEFRQRLQAYLGKLLHDKAFVHWNEENYIRVRGSVVGEEQEEEGEDVLALIKELARSRRLMILEGGPGTGKTTVLQRLILEWAGEISGHGLDSESLPHVPVLIDLKSYTGQSELTPQFSSFLRSHDLKLDAQELVELLTTSEMVVLVDGFDKMYSKYWGSGMTALRSYFTQYPHHTKIVACRTHMRDRLIAQLDPVEYVEVQLRPLAQHQVWNYLQRRPSLPIGLRDQVKTSAGLMSLLCHNLLVCSYLVEAATAGPEIGPLSANIGALLERIMRHIVERDRDALLREHKHPPSVISLCRMLSYLGWNVCNEGGASCSGKDATAWIGEIKAKTRARRYNTTQLTNWLESTFWLQEKDDDRLYFQHPYVVDILAAMELKERFTEVGNSAALGLGPSSDPVKWEEVVVLLAGMLQEEQAINLIKALLDANQVHLAGRCVAEGQLMPHSIVARVIHALQTQLTGVEQQ